MRIGTPRQVRLPAVMVMLSLIGCSRAGRVPIQSYQSTQDYVTRAELTADPDAVYRAAIREVQERAARIKIVKRDDANRLLQITDGVQNASITATPSSGGKTEIVVVADVPENAEDAKKEEELSLRMIRFIANALKVRYKVLKQ